MSALGLSSVPDKVCVEYRGITITLCMSAHILLLCTLLIWRRSGSSTYSFWTGLGTYPYDLDVIADGSCSWEPLNIRPTRHFTRMLATALLTPQNWNRNLDFDGMGHRHGYSPTVLQTASLFPQHI